MYGFICMRRSRHKLLHHNEKIGEKNCNKYFASVCQTCPAFRFLLKHFGKHSSCFRRANGNVQNMHAKDKNNKHNTERLDSSCSNPIHSLPLPFSKVIVTNKQNVSQQIQYIQVKADILTKSIFLYYKNQSIWVQYRIQQGKSC